MKSVFKIVAMVVFILLSAYSSAKGNVRKCMLLPIEDSLKGAIGFKVYEAVEKYLKSSDWCYYRSNSEIINILGNYKNQLGTHLKNPEVLRLLAEKSDSGSLIKISLKKDISGFDINLEIFSHSGVERLYFNQSKLTSNDISRVNSLIFDWLEEYKKSIPYDGIVLGVLGNQVTFDIGKNYGMSKYDEIHIVRPLKKIKHPFLKKTVEWKTVMIADGRPTSINQDQSQGALLKYFGKSRPMVGDWIIIKKNKFPMRDGEGKKMKMAKNPFGKIGSMAFAFDIGTGSSTVTTQNANPKKFGGMAFGIDLNLSLWLTRHYWISFDLIKRIGAYTKESGVISTEANSLSMTVTKFLFGYKYLPLGFYFGPQVDIYAGFSTYNYGYDNQQSDQFGEVEYDGLLFGAKGNIPLYRKIRIFLGLNFILSPAYTEGIQLFGKEDSSSNYHLDFGVNYNYETNILVEASINFTSSGSKFSDGVITSSSKNTFIKIGSVFIF